MTAPLDEDALQEYALALLEGDDDDSAMQRAVRATNVNSSSRQLRTRNLGFGDADWRIDHNDHRSATMDPRSDEQRDIDWERREAALKYLDHCNPKQREVLILRYGIGTGVPLTLHQTAEVLGYRYHSSVQQLEGSGLRAIRKAAAEAEAYTPEQLTRLEQKRAYNREKLRQWRANQKGIAA